MPRARRASRCGARTRSSPACGAPAVFNGRCRRHSGNATALRPPWTLTATPEALGAYPGHQHPREPHVRRRTRELRPVAAVELIRRGIITRAVFLASTTKPDRFLRRLEREGIRVELESRSELVRSYRFVVPD